MKTSKLFFVLALAGLAFASFSIRNETLAITRFT